jgi:glycosyltransferase involved in cell wall biosynthesis
MRESSGSNGKTIVYFVTEDWYFCSHRLQLAIAAKEAGYSVYVITRVNSHGAEIEAAGLNLVPVTLSRRSKNPIVEAIFIRKLIRIYKDIYPDIVHHVAIKPVIYGSIAARLAGIQNVVNAMAGLGFLFSSGQPTARLFRPAINFLFGLLLNNNRTTVILQNPDDVDVLCGSGTIDRRRVRLIRGSGVDTDVYGYEAESNEVPIVLLASRLLWDKGVGEFVAAARTIRRSGIDARFVLAGDNDDENPGSISTAQLKEWNDEGAVECWGHCTNMPNIFAGIHIVCLPTAYGEGIPKVLIEAASCGRPIVATDAPGCREIVIDGKNGILVPVNDTEALSTAIRKLLHSPLLRKSMGEFGRQLVEAQFSLERVNRETLAVYESVAT